MLPRRWQFPPCSTSLSVCLSFMVVQQVQTHRVTVGVLVLKEQRNNFHTVDL